MSYRDQGPGTNSGCEANWPQACQLNSISLLRIGLKIRDAENFQYGGSTLASYKKQLQLRIQRERAEILASLQVLSKTKMTTNI